MIHVSAKEYKNTIFPDGLIFDFSFWKKNSVREWKRGTKVFHEGKWLSTWWPKRNTKKGRELSSKISEALGIGEFFKEDDIGDLIGFKPKNKVEKTSRNTILINDLEIGFRIKRTGKHEFIFRSYTGYKPVRGVKEILISEFEKVKYVKV